MQTAMGAHARRGTAAARACAIAIFVLLSWNFSAEAQTQDAGTPLSFAQQQTARAALNNATLLVAAGPHLSMAQDVAAVVGRSEDVRLLPIASPGGLENLRELAFLRGVDMAIVPTNVLSHVKAIEAQVGAGILQRIAYISHLYSEDVHLLVGESVGVLTGLSRRKVGVLLDDGNALFAARDLFGRLKIAVEIVQLQAPEALEQVRTGQLAGLILLGGKPLSLLAGLPKDGRLRFLNLPFSPDVEQGYVPAALRAEDYPTLIPPGVTVDTVAVGAVLMAHSGRGAEESARRLARFVPAFFSSVADLALIERNAKWRELNLATPLVGWSRLPAAEEWLRNAREQQKASLQKEFETFLRSSRPPGAPELTPAQRKKLFDDFVQWTRQSVGAAPPRVP